MKKLSLLLFFVTLLTTFKLYTGVVNAYDVSNAGYGAVGAVTDNPTDYFDVWYDKSPGGKFILINVNPSCSNTLSVQVSVVGDPNASNTGGCSTNPIQISYNAPGYPTNANANPQIDCPTENDNAYCHFYVKVTLNVNTPGHFTFGISVSGGTNGIPSGNPIVSYAGSSTPDQDPASPYPQYTPYKSQYYNFGTFQGNPVYTWKAPCSLKDNTAYVAWSGADWGAVFNGQVQKPSWELKDLDGNLDKVESGPALIGDQQHPEIFSASFAMQAGHRYQWSWSGVTGNNEITYVVPFTGNSFTKDHQCVDYSLKPATAVVGSKQLTTKIGDPNVQSTTFNQSVTNLGPDNGSFTWQIQGSYYHASTNTSDNWDNNNCGGQGTNEPTSSRCPLPSGTVTNGSVGTDVNWNPTYKFPSNAQGGDQYCQRIEATYTGGQNNGQTVDSLGGCVTYVAPVVGNVTGDIYLADPSPWLPGGKGQTEKATGISLMDCRGDTTSDNGNGSYGFTVPNQAGFCVRILPDSTPYQPYIPTGYNGPYTRPTGTGNNQGYLDHIGNTYLSWCPYENPHYYFNSTVGYGSGNFTYPAPDACIGGEITYENQFAGEFKPPSQTVQDRATDNGYDFVYNINPPGGTITSATCGLSNGLSGYASEAAVPGNSLTIYIYKNNTYVGQTTTDPNNNGYFTYPLTGSNIADGSGHNITVLIIGESMYGDWDGSNTPLNVSMAGCRPYTITPTGYVNPTQTNENPGIINFGVNLNFSPVPAIGAPSCANPTQITYTITHNTPSGSTQLASGSPSNCYGSGQYQMYSYTVPPGSFNAGDTYCIQGNVSPYAAYIDANGNIIPGSVTTPQYAYGPTCMTIVNEPYVKVYNSGVSAAGGAVENGFSCQGGQITSWNDDSGLYPGYGAGSQLAAIAHDEISGFASAQNTSSFLTSGQPPGVGLTFGNVSNLSGGYQDTPNMGGNYSDHFCYDLNTTTNLPTTPLPPSHDVSTLSGNGRYIVGSGYSPNSGTTISASRQIGNGTNSVIYVKGNVYIAPDPQGGIVYQGTGWTWNPTSTNIPSFALIAMGGNIYIDPGVTTLDGVYAAVKDSSGHGGTIYDCGSSSYQPLSSNTNMFSVCKNQLVVHGSFIADNVNLLRSFGSLRDETPQTAVSTTIPGQSATPCLSSFHSYPCTPDGTGGIYSYVNYSASYNLHNPAGTGYSMTINYTNFTPPGNSWPPSGPAYGKYNYDVNVNVNSGSGSRTISAYLSPDTSTYTIFLGTLRNNTRVTLDWTNNYWIDHNGNIETGTVYDPAYDPNLDIKSLTLSAAGSNPPPTSCSNAGSWGDHQTCAAEVFDFSPEEYIGNFQLTPPGNTSLQYDSYTSLPPVL